MNQTNFFDLSSCHEGRGLSACPYRSVESCLAPTLPTHTLACLGECVISSSSLIGIARRLTGSLLQNRLFSVGEHGILPLVDTLQPVSKAPTDTGEYGPGPERAAVEEWPHLEAELPESSGDSEAGPEQDSGHHCESEWYRSWGWLEVERCWQRSCWVEVMRSHDRA